MAKRRYKRILLEDISTDTVKHYKKVWEEMPDEVVKNVSESPSEPVVEEVELTLGMSNTKAELLTEAERLDLDVNSGNTKSEILAAIEASKE